MLAEAMTSQIHVLAHPQRHVPSDVDLICRLEGEPSICTQRGAA